MKDGLLDDALRPPPHAVGAAEVRAFRAGSLWYVEEVAQGRRRLRAWDGEAWRAAPALPSGARPVETEVTKRADDGFATTVVLRDDAATEEVAVGSMAPSPPRASVLGLALLLPLALAVDAATAPLQLLGFLGALLIFEYSLP